MLRREARRGGTIQVAQSSFWYGMGPEGAEGRAHPASEHGTDALSVAQQRAEEWSERGEERAANLWRVIGSAVLAILNRVRRTTGRRASLPEVLHRSVTQKVVDADKVERHHVERLMRRAKRRCASNDL